MTTQQALLKQLRKRSTAPEALEALRSLGHLTDGSLEGKLLYGAKLSGTDLRYARLAGATLSGVDLHGADLRHADFNGADLIDANLRHVNASHADFSGADFIAAKFSGADLTGTDLRDATLGGTDLSYAHLHYTRLEDTSLYEAICDHTVFASVDLSTVRGLETLRHYGPSEVGLDTLLRSGGALPEEFLRGCGLSQAVISGLPSVLAEPTHYHTCFISFSHADAEFAYRLYARLRDYGLSCWLDEHQMAAAVDFHRAMYREMRLWQKTVVCVSRAALESWWLEDEVALVLANQASYGGTSLMVVSIDDALTTFDGPHAAAMRDHLAVDFAEWADDEARFVAQTERLMAVLRVT